MKTDKAHIVLVYPINGFSVIYSLKFDDFVITSKLYINGTNDDKNIDITLIVINLIY